MIVRRNLKLSIVARMTWRAVLFFAVAGVTSSVIAHVLDLKRDLIPPGAVSALSTALAIFLAFRNSSAYDRWWESRKLWGTLINSSRTFARQVMTFTTGEWARKEFGTERLSSMRKLLVYRQIAFAHALRLMLRGQQAEYRQTLEPFLPPDELERVVSSTNAPAMIIELQAETLRDAHHDGMIDNFRHVQFDGTLTSFTDVEGGCERIKNTPLPRPYDYYPRAFLWFYSILLPLSLASHLRWWTPAISVPISFLFLVLSNIGRNTEDPFENRIQDIPLTALCRTIERNLREALGEKDLPPPLQPVDGFLF
jgi:putative membrane protein